MIRDGFNGLTMVDHRTVMSAVVVGWVNIFIYVFTINQFRYYREHYISAVAFLAMKQPP